LAAENEYLATGQVGGVLEVPYGNLGAVKVEERKA
jgi:hypothetical protein